MPKVNYEKQPFRVCRWNNNYHGSKDGEYWCDYGKDNVDEDYCMKCFCNDWYQRCDRCNKEKLKTEIKHIFEREIIAMSYVCNECYDGEDIVERIPKTEENIIYHINKWKELNKE